MPPNFSRVTMPPRPVRPEEEEEQEPSTNKEQKNKTHHLSYLSLMPPPSGNDLKSTGVASIVLLTATSDTPGAASIASTWIARTPIPPVCRVVAHPLLKPRHVVSCGHWLPTKLMWIAWAIVDVMGSVRAGSWAHEIIVLVMFLKIPDTHPGPAGWWAPATWRANSKPVL